jgi:aspartyl-tRNA(Asn)/glutamyl-tRNA(Gln) amidotransferase subunit A
VRDVALALGLVAGYDPADPHSADRPVDDYRGALEGDLPVPRLGLARSFYHGVADDEVSRHVDAIANRFADAGARVAEIEMPLGAQATWDLGQPIMRAEAAFGHRELFPSNRDVYPPLARTLVEAGQKMSALEYQEALQARATFRRELIDRVSDFDAILLPVALSTAPRGFSSTGSPWFCAPASFAGLPSIALPSGLGEGGLPLSVQLIAGPFAESQLLLAAAWAERILDFGARPALAAGT